MKTVCPLTNEITVIEELLVHESIAKARQRVRSLVTRKVPRKSLLTVASLARLSRLPEIAVRLLRPVVRSSGRTLLVSTAAERTEYAAALTDLGAHHEATELLSTVRETEVPKKLFVEALLHSYCWDHDRAIPLLEGFLKTKDLTEVFRLAAMINLGSALAQATTGAGADRYARAGEVLSFVLRATAPHHHRLHYKNALLAMVRVFFKQERFRDALDALDRLEQDCIEQEDLYTFRRMQMWRAVIRLNSAPKQPATAASDELRRIHDLSMAEGLWEVSRACDLYTAARAAKTTDNHALLARLYFGTPLPAFRARVQALLGPTPLPAHYDWIPGTHSVKTTKFWIDAVTGQNNCTGDELNEPQLLRLFQALCADFYKPSRLAELHERLFPGGHYNPASSPNRVYQALRRLRVWLARSGLPLIIVEEKGHYRLACAEGRACRVRIGNAALPTKSRMQQRIERMQHDFPSQPFTAHDAAEALDISHRTAHSCIDAAKSLGLLETIGSGPSTRYRILQKPKSS